NKSVNDTLTAELERYKEQVKVLKEGQNVDLKSKDNISDSCAQSVEIDRLKQTLSEHLKEKESLMQTKAQQLEPKLYDGNIIKNTSDIMILDSKETLMLVEESHFEKQFVPQTELSAEQAFWSQNSINSSNPNPSCRTTIVEVPNELPKVSMVNTILKKLKHYLAGFDVVVKERTTATAITEGSWGFEHTKACFRNEIIPFVKALKDLFNTFDQYLIDELSKEQFCCQIKEARKCDNLFKLNELKAQSQEKDTVIKKLKERIKSLSGKQNEDKIKKDLEEIETINIELDHREKFGNYSSQEDLRKLKGKALVDNDVTKLPSDPEMLKINMEPITPKLLNK
ncbi:hypothetical protein Tco_0573470, partial [Tanacetum coccineum]